MAVIPGFSIQHGKVISATLIVAVTGLILNPTLSVPLQLFQPPGWSWQCIPCPPSKMGLQAGSQPLPSDLKPGIGTGLPLPYFFFHFAYYRNCCRSLQVFLELCLHWQDWAVGVEHFQEELFCCGGDK